VVGLFVIEQDLFAGPDVAFGEEEDVFVDDLHVAVRFAGVVDVLGAVSGLQAVNCPVLVDAADVDAAFAFQPASDFATRNLFADVFGHLASSFERRRGEAAAAVNPGGFDFNSESEFWFHLCQ